MEIFLLFIVIILMVIFETSRSTKINALEKKLSSLEAYIKNLAFTLSQKETAKNEPVSKPAEVKPVVRDPLPEKIIPKDEPPLITPEIEPSPVFQNFGVSSPGIVTEHIEEEEETQKDIEEETKQEKEEIAEPIQRVAAIKAPPRKVVVPQEDWYTRFRKNNPDLEKFIGENILSKVAITILVIGIAFFVKFAIDKEWINEIARVGIGILCGGIVLGFAHRLHTKFKAFSSVLVGGGIAIFYFTIGIGFHQYHIFNQTTAFVIMFLITAFSVFISVSYDRIELAALSIIGGFATPFMVSTGEGNYQVLFTYILILDCGMLVLAYLRKWSLINILTYCLTMLLYVIWLESKVIDKFNGPYMGALIFGAIFYFIFILMNIINNVKEKRKFDAFELSMLLSNTFLFYGEGMHILNYYHPEFEGLFSACIAIFNLICAWLLYKKFKADEKLVYLMIGLTLTFITVSAPVQLHGNYITLFWAIESVLLIWLAQRSKIILYRFASVVITGLMLMSLCMDWIQVYSAYSGLIVPVLLNKAFITGLISAFSAGAIIYLLRKEVSATETQEEIRFAGIEFHPKNYSSFLRIVFIVLLYCTGIFELMYQLRERMEEHVAFFIVVQTYHLLFVIALNYGLSRTQNRHVSATLNTLNLISLIVFLLGFVLLPVFDFKENITQTEMNYTGFIFHYVCLLAAVFLGLKIKALLKKNQSETIYKPELITAIISAAIVYICSTELILHIAQFTMSNVTDETTTTVINKLGEFRTTSLHVVKIGFPILWGMLAFLFLSLGMKTHNKTFRISGLILIALILVKLFTYDIKDASEAGKIIAFIILGVVLLIISFMYQKIKALLIDDTKTKETETEINPE